MPMTRPTGKLDEHAFNREFARVLAETDPRWLARANEYILAERTGTLDRGRADVLIDDPGMPAAAVETSFDSEDADRDARNRLADGRLGTAGSSWRRWRSTYPRNVRMFLPMP